MGTTRRSFIKMTAALTASLSLPLKTLGEEASPDIFEVRGDKAQATREAVRLLGGIERFVKKGAKVVVKPNIGFARTPDIGATTSPEVVAEVCKMSLEAGARKVLVLDYPVHKPSLCLERSGIAAACAGLADTSVFCVSEKKFFSEVEIPKGITLKNVMLAKDILECDCFINVPVAKSHGSALVTCGMKNLMGIIWDRRKFHVFTELHQSIADLATVAVPQLIIVDASRILHTGGPQGPGELTYRHSIFAGTKQATVDAHAVTLSTWSNRTLHPRQVDYIRMAHNHGLGEIEPEKMKILRKSLV